ncbi:Crp/Fnr family transcriptional regulator [Candidatus Magnetobacterium casense]|uniref:Crp/Fnr family transcriptional regulator n=1 Tax=Candidatus Magnetobacterium casense TaxID=1455061 RepID=UPI00058BC102|nr:Crp/Fnr family transcriptional regulator [Candidatus Magnetobacterium casensis]
MKIDGLRHNALFRDVTEAELQYIDTYARTFSLDKDETVFTQGDTSNGIYFLDGGRIRLSKLYHDGRKLTLDVIEPGEFFGEMALAGEKHRSTTAEATERATGIEIRKNVFEEFLRKRPDIAIKLLQLIGDKRQSMESLLEDMAFMDVQGRIASLLIKYSENGLVKIPLTHQEIADMTGTSRVSVTRSIIKLRDKGLIETTGDRIRLSDIGKLQKLISWSM